MKKVAVFAVLTAFLFSSGVYNVYAQSSIDTYLNLSEDQRVKSKELQDEYKENKADLELQLKKLQKDREIAIRDQNVSLVERRTQEIKQTQTKIKTLAKEYSGKYSDILTDEQKKEANVGSDFYAKELAAEQAKMETADKKNASKEKPAAKPAKSSKKQPAKKKAAVKSEEAPQDNEPVAVSDEELEMLKQAQQQ